MAKGWRERAVGTWRHDALGVWMFVWCYAPMVAALALFHRYPNVGTFFLAMAVVAFRMNALFVVTHESWHFNVFRSRAANQWLGAALASYPIVMPYFKDRTTHWDHHRYVGTPRDPDAWAWDYKDGEQRKLARDLLAVASGTPYLIRIARIIVGRPAPGQGRPGSAITKGEIARIILVHLVILGIFWRTIGAVWYVPLWLFPGLALFPVVTIVREFLEHRRGAIIIYPRANVLERFLLGCFNFHLHGYHHAFASAPWFTLPDMDERARRRVKEMVTLESYFGELVAYARGRSPAFRGREDETEVRDAGDQSIDERKDED